MARKGNREVQIIGLLLSLAIALIPLRIWKKTYGGVGKLLWWIAVIVILIHVARPQQPLRAARLGA